MESTDSNTLPTKDSRRRDKPWPWRPIWKMHITDCNSNGWSNSCLIWCQLGAHKMAYSSTPGKTGLPYNLETGSPRPKNWQWDSPVPCPLQCLHKGTGGSAQQWFKPDAYACRRQAYVQNSQWHPHSSQRCPGAAGKSQIGAKGQSPESIQARRKPCGASSTTKQ